MIERPILMSGAMVRATMRDRDPKIQTRRPIKPQPRIDDQGNFCWKGSCYGQSPDHTPHVQAIASPYPSARTGKVLCPFGKPGDRLWVRETWADVNLWGAPGVAYRADDAVRDLMDDESFLDDEGAFNYGDPRVQKLDFAAWASDLLTGTEGRWRPSIHMPRWACRLVLAIAGIRVERLHDISEADAIAEGIDGPACAELSTQSPWTNVVAPAAVHAYAALWEQTYGAGAWAANPWVWVVDFRRGP